MLPNVTSRCFGGSPAFERVWHEAAAVNISARTPPMLNDWWEGLLAKVPALKVAGPLRPGQCAAEDYCVGVSLMASSGGNSCVCQSP